MNETHQREQAIFDAALAVSLDERAAYLDRACCGDTELRNRVEALLIAGGPTSDYLEGAAVPGVAHSRTVVLTETAGDTIDRYKLLQQIGEGGCGVVYMAEQEEPVRRRVALKVIKLGMDTKSVIARFEAERQALAMMDHPNIAKVLDAGATETGRPYFVMELVRGIKITDYCDQLKLSTRDRLGLFISVCQAVQHAHQKGIIHRDLKPSNILVTEHDGKPVPKIIDFGIAKATTGQRLTDQTLFTAFEQFIGTPAYTSPEQAGLGGLDIDTRSDIYSLGVLLYELLTGRTPFSPEELKCSAIDEVLRVIRESEPPRPSARVTTLSERELTTVAEQRRIETTRLPSVLRGELDWIVMKCLEKDRTRRYETANGLASDIQRHLNQEPVLACPPSNIYRFRKLVRRNKLAFGAAAGIAAALVVGLSVATWMFFKERAALRRAVAAEEEQIRLRKEAETEAAKSQQVARFLRDMLKGVGPSVALGRDTTLLKEILDKTIERLGKELTNQPAVEAELRHTIGNVYEAFWQHEQAEAMLRESLRLRRNLYGTTNAVVVESLEDLAWTLSQEKSSEAESVAREALSLRRRQVAAESLDVARSMFVLGTVLAINGSEEKQDEAEKLLHDALAIERKLAATNDVRLSASLHNLGLFLHQRGKSLEAESFYREALAMARALYGKEHPDIAISLHCLADLHYERGQYAEAEGLLLEALAMNKKLFGPDHLRLVSVLHRLAAVVAEQSRYDEAERLVGEAMALVKKHHGEHHAEYAYSVNRLGEVFERQQKYAEAEPLYRQAAVIRENLNHPFLLTSVEHVSTVLLRQGKAEEAEAFFRNALSSQRKLRHTNDASLANWLNAFGALLQGRNKLAEAEPIYREALAIRKTLLGDDHPETTLTMRNLAAVLGDRRQYPEAERLQREALAANRKRLKDHTAIVNDLQKLSDLVRHQSRYDDAERIQREAVEVEKKLVGAEHPAVAPVLNRLGDLLERQRKYAEAETVYREAMAIRKKINDSDLSSSMQHMARAAWNQGKRAEAEALLLELVRVGDKTQASQVDLLRRRGEFYARHGQWKQAVADLSKVIELRPAEYSPYWTLGAVLLQSGDASSYRQFCDKLLDQFGATTEPDTALRASAQCLMLPGACTNWGILTRLMNFAGSNFKRNSTTRALVEYRNGNFEAAVEECRRVLRESPNLGRTANAQSIIAMSEASLGHKEAAWNAFDAATTIVTTNLAPGDYGDLGPDYADSLHARVVLREVEATLKQKLGARESVAK